MRLDKIAIGHNPPYDINVIVEVSVGSDPVKYELDKESGALFVDRFLHTAMTYPVNYGFIPHTLSDDGDPCDVIVLNPTPVVPGCIIRSRPIGVLKMEDEERDVCIFFVVSCDGLLPHICFQFCITFLFCDIRKSVDFQKFGVPKICPNCGRNPRFP